MKEQLDLLQQAFPQAIKIYQPATATQILQTEQLLGLKLSDVDPSWLDFLRLTNGASVLDYCIMGAMTSHIENIADANRRLWNLNLYDWLRKHFICFLGTSSPMMIGFVREGRRTRCIAFLAELTDNAVLPIASSFETFVGCFLQDVETTLRTWKPLLGEEWPYAISDTWPLELKSWYQRDPKLKTMLQEGVLDDLFRHDDEYTAIVDGVLKT